MIRRVLFVMVMLLGVVFVSAQAGAQTTTDEYHVQLMARYDVLQVAYWNTTDLSKLKSIEDQIEAVSAELTRINQEQLAETTLKLQLSGAEFVRTLYRSGVELHLQYDRPPRWQVWHWSKRLQMDRELHTLEAQDRSHD